MFKKESPKIILFYNGCTTAFAIIVIVYEKKKK